MYKYLLDYFISEDVICTREEVMYVALISFSDIAEGFISTNVESSYWKSC